MCGLPLQHGLNMFGLSLPNVLDKCVACLCNMVWVCLNMCSCSSKMAVGYMSGFAPLIGLDKCMACLSKMVGINLWLASANRFGSMRSLSLQNGLD